MYDAEDFFPPPIATCMLPNFDPGTLVSTSTVITGSVCTAPPHHRTESLPHT